MLRHDGGGNFEFNDNEVINQQISIIPADSAAGELNLNGAC